MINKYYSRYERQMIVSGQLTKLKTHVIPTLVTDAANAEDLNVCCGVLVVVITRARMSSSESTGVS